MKLASFFQIPASAPGAANFGFVFSTPALAFRPLPIGFVFSKPTSPTSNPQNSPYLRFRSAILASKRISPQGGIGFVFSNSDSPTSPFPKFAIPSLPLRKIGFEAYISPKTGFVFSKSRSQTPRSPSLAPFSPPNHRNICRPDLVWSASLNP